MTEIWFDLLHMPTALSLAIGSLLALAVTIHVLLRKREVAAAAGWIGLVWYAPVLGAVTYLLFGINRVRRRARRLRPPDLAPAAGRPEPAAPPAGFVSLVQGIDRITGRPLVAGNSVRSYRNGDEAYPAMLDAIAGARRSIGLASYIFRDDAWGGRFITALAEAKRRGVEVRVLIDGIGGGWLRSSAFRRLRRLGVPAARFLHSMQPWRMPFLNLRNHRKILVIDGAVGFTGGMNIADENVMATRPAAPVRDVHFRLEGPVVGQLVAAFAEDWDFATDEYLLGPAWFPAIAAPEGVPGRVIDSGPDEDLEKIEFAVQQAIACARSRIVVMTPYFLPDDRLVTALALAAMRGVAVEVVLPERTDHRMVDWAARANIGPLLDDGVRLWWSPRPFHHGKLMVVDDAWCLIGSCNWDVRSFRLNFELCVELYSPELASALVALVETCRGCALRSEDLARRPLPVRLRDAGTRLLLPYL